MIQDPLSLHAKQTPHAIAITLDTHSITYKELDAFVHSASKKLPSLQTRKIAFRTSDTLRSLIIIWACLRARVMFLPLNPSFPDDYIQGFLHSAGISHTTEIHALVRFDTCNDSIPEYTLSKDQLCSIICTSGSSGTPKLAVHRLNNHIASACASQTTLPLTHGDSWLLNLPLFHVSGLSILFRCILAGATVNLDTNHPYTHSSLVPTQLQEKLKNEDPLFLNSKYCLVGGSAFPTHLKLPSSPKILPTYGLTEMSSQVITDHTLLKSADIYIEPNTHELWVKGDALFCGYLNEGLCTLPLNESGFFNTKDRIRFQDSTFQYLGRSDRMLISGGENIQPEEIETVLLQHPDITRAAVIGVPHPKYGERPIAFIECENFEHVKKSLENLLNPLPKFMRPDIIKPLPKLDSNQKISYKNLRIYALNTT